MAADDRVHRPAARLLEGGDRPDQGVAALAGLDAAHG